MTLSWAETGLGWAPEQWQAQRKWVSESEADSRAGSAGFAVTSPQWIVFTDVSREYASHAALVLESAWVQAHAAIVAPRSRLSRVDARIYRNRSDYERLAYKGSGGVWDPSKGCVMTCLDDPQRPQFGSSSHAVLVHEATHAVMTYARVAGPAWLNEGLACYVERWDPAASPAVNRERVKGWLRRTGTLRSAHAAGILPAFDGLTRLVSVKPDWIADDFGPITHAHYAAAESLLVFMGEDPLRWALVGRWLHDVRNDADPIAKTPRGRLDVLAKDWEAFVAARCAD
jgi:hypothetical protein